MADKPRNYKKLLWQLSESAADAIENMTDQELLVESQMEGGDVPERTTEDVLNIFRSVEKKQKQKEFIAAKKLYALRQQEIRWRRVVLPESRQEKRKLFDFAMTKMPELGMAFTAQYRDLRDLTEDDIDSFLKQMEQLGVLEEIVKKTSSE
jgi:hypothetical protein